MVFLLSAVNLNRVRLSSASLIEFSTSLSTHLSRTLRQLVLNLSASWETRKTPIMSVSATPFDTQETQSSVINSVLDMDRKVSCQ